MDVPDGGDQIGETRLAGSVGLREAWIRHRPRGDIFSFITFAVKFSVSGYFFGFDGRVYEEVEESCSSMMVGFDGVLGCDDTFILHLQGIEYCIVEQSEEERGRGARP